MLPVHGARMPMTAPAGVPRGAGAEWHNSCNCSRQPNTALSQAGASQSRWLNQADQVQFSRDGLALGRLIRMWGSVASLFGLKGKPQAGPIFDLVALREALQEAQRRATEIKSRQGVLDTLRSSALRESERLVEDYYGLLGDGARMRIVLEEEMGGALASVSYRYDRNGRAENLHLHINLSQFRPDTGPNGTNNHVIENDRIVAHEVVHAVMGRNMDISRLPDWFMEGTAEYIAGGAERVALTLQQLSPQQLMNRLAHPWVGDNSQYAAGYIAVRYLDYALHKGGGIRALMARLKAGDSLDQAIHIVSGAAYLSTGDFLDELVSLGGGEFLIRNIDLSGRDAGSVQPGRGPEIVADRRVPSSQPLRGFQIQWPSPLEGMSFGQASPWFGLPTARSAAAAYHSQAIFGHKVSS